MYRRASLPSRMSSIVEVEHHSWRASLKSNVVDVEHLADDRHRLTSSIKDRVQEFGDLPPGGDASGLGKKHHGLVYRNWQRSDVVVSVQDTDTGGNNC